LFFVFDGEALRLYEEKRSSRASARVNLLDMVVNVDFCACLGMRMCAVSWCFIWSPGRRLAVRGSSCSWSGAVESRGHKSEDVSGARVVWRRVCDCDRVSGGECVYKGREVNRVPWGIVVERTLFFCGRGSEQVASEVRRSWVVLTPRRLGNTLLQRRRRVRARVVVD
jgi:hypothetical protein